MIENTDIEVSMFKLTFPNIRNVLVYIIRFGNLCSFVKLDSYEPKSVNLINVHQMITSKAQYLGKNGGKKAEEEAS